MFWTTGTHDHWRYLFQMLPGTCRDEHTITYDILTLLGRVREREKHVSSPLPLPFLKILQFAFYFVNFVYNLIFKDLSVNLTNFTAFQLHLQHFKRVLCLLERLNTQNKKM